jgi:hypothetical protein
MGCSSTMTTAPADPPAELSSDERVLVALDYLEPMYQLNADGRVIKLRITHPELPRPYRAWGYPVTPVVFLLVTGFMMYYLLTERPLQSVLGIVIMISGLLIYAVFRKRAPQDAVAASAGRE